MSSSSLTAEPVASSLQTSLEGYVGFDTITQQIEKKLLKRGFHFNVMVVGKCVVKVFSLLSDVDQLYHFF